MSLIQGVRKNLLYFSVTIPLVLIGYEFLMYSTTANRGWLFILMGQVVLVPLIYFILSLCFSRIFNGTQGNTIFGLVLLILFSFGLFVVTPIALEGTGVFK